jgi:hypothetical protein
LLTTLAFLVTTTASFSPGSGTDPKPSSTIMCFFSHETVDGFSKICFYDCMCGTKALSVKAYQLCPINARFECF